MSSAHLSTILDPVQKGKTPDNAINGLSAHQKPRKQQNTANVITSDLIDSEDAIDLEKEFSEALMEAITELGTSDLDAFIHEPDEISLVIDLCESPEDYWTIRVDYGEAGWSRSEAFMMVYDVMRDAGIVAILLNDAEDDETGISEDLRPDAEVRH